MKVSITFEYENPAANPGMSHGELRQMVFDDLQNAAVLHHLHMAMLAVKHKGNEGFAAAVLEEAVKIYNSKADAISKGIITDVEIG